MKLKNKVAVITGGNSGIGLAIANEFKENGAKIAILGRDKATLEAAASALGEDTVSVRGDVRKMADLETLFRKTEEHLGKVDIVVANAGIAKFATVQDLSEELFDELCDIHFKGAFFTVQKALPHMRDGGSIVLISSSPAQSRGSAMTSIYNAAKAAVRSLGRTLATELLPRKIRVNTLSPGLTNTPILSRDIGLPPEVRDQIAKSFIGQIPMGRLGEAKDLAKAALFLASDDSSYIVGAELAVDGGLAQL